MEKNILKKEEDFHDKWANSVNLDDVLVDEFFEACTSPENRQIMKWLGDVKGKKVLELGCGLGEASVYLAKKGAKVTATDLSGGMLKVAEKVAQKHQTYIDTVKCSADSIPFEENSFDIVYAANILHHVDLEAVMRESSRVLKRGGYFVSWDPLAHNPVINVYRKLASAVRTEDEHPLRMSDLEIYRKYFRKVRYDGKWFLTNLIFLKFFFVDRINPSEERYWKLILKDYKKLEKLYFRLEKWDRFLLKRFPFLKRYCWNIVVIAKK